ncbi:MAG: alpha-L-rhamnosidase C-terminal domain-containing protein, partial [Prolixibacteraceae bacterium]|nr:alpha-L-rhamnosidase C-terminal domain-containing protein [Prolixibacteraceae bacterium]
ISLNHIMFGEINAWYYKALGGIFPDEKQPGFKNVIRKPKFVNGLKEFEAEHQGPFGRIISSWKRSSGSVSYDVAIPTNSTATLYLPGGADITESGRPLEQNNFIDVKGKINDKICLSLKSGRYSFTISD